MAHAWVTRQVPARVDPVGLAIDELFRGPTEFEQQHGIRPAFSRSVSEPDKPLLRRDQVRVAIRDGVAIVDFVAAASHHLQQAICARMGVVSAIELTLLQFEGVRAVQFAIAGEVITEWDA